MKVIDDICIDYRNEQEVELTLENVYDICDNCEEVVGENNLHEMRRDSQEMWVCEYCRDNELDDWKLIL